MSTIYTIFFSFSFANYILLFYSFLSLLLIFLLIITLTCFTHSFTFNSYLLHHSINYSIFTLSTSSLFITSYLSHPSLLQLLSLLLHPPYLYSPSFFSILIHFILLYHSQFLDSLPPSSSLNFYFFISFNSLLIPLSISISTSFLLFLFLFTSSFLLFISLLLPLSYTPSLLSTINSLSLHSLLFLVSLLLSISFIATITSFSPIASHTLHLCSPLINSSFHFTFYFLLLLYTSHISKYNFHFLLTSHTFNSHLLLTHQPTHSV